MINIALLKQLCETPGAPGFEQRIRKLIIELVTPLVDHVSVDPMGNVTALKKGREDKRMMIAAHMDEISFIVTHIDEDGFLRFHTLGGFDPKTLTSQRVIVHGREDILGVMGSKPIHLMKPEDRSKVPQIQDYYIDLGRPKSEVMELVAIGDPITRERELVEMGSCINSKSLDNRVSVFILIEVLRELKDVSIPYDLHAVFTVQEEVGLRGALKAAHQIDPHYGLALDVTIAFDVPGAQAHEAVTHLGKGTAIKIMDSTSICDYRMVRYLKELAIKQNIPWQPEVLPAGGTDTAGVQRSGKSGAIAGAISIPLRHIHQVIETVHKDDIISSIKLLRASIEHIDQYNWEFN